jgi:hypothetical protein
MKSWEEAFRLSGKIEPPEISYSHGWFTVGGMKFRKKEIEESIKVLSERAKEDKIAASNLIKVLRGQ